VPFAIAVASGGVTLNNEEVGQGGLLATPRADGFTDGFNVIQGVRSMDSNQGTWTTPDAYAGVVEDLARMVNEMKKSTTFAKIYSTIKHDPKNHYTISYNTKINDKFGPTGLIIQDTKNSDLYHKSSPKSAVNSIRPKVGGYAAFVRSFVAFRSADHSW